MGNGNGLNVVRNIAEARKMGQKNEDGNYHNRNVRRHWKFNNRFPEGTDEYRSDEWRECEQECPHGIQSRNADGGVRKIG
jgi:hypothetical protein